MSTPSTKITAVFLAGVVMTALWALANEFYFKPKGITLSPELATSVNVAVVSAVGYFIPNSQE